MFNDIAERANMPNLTNISGTCACIYWRKNNWQIFQGVVYNASKPIWRRRRGKSDVRWVPLACLTSYITACPQHCNGWDHIFICSQPYIFTYIQEYAHADLFTRVHIYAYMKDTNVLMLSFALVAQPHAHLAVLHTSGAKHIAPRKYTCIRKYASFPSVCAHVSGANIHHACDTAITQPPSIGDTNRRRALRDLF